jgi:cholesterol oxidase
MSDATVLPFGPTSAISKYVGVLERVRGNGIDLYCGAGVGGGSLVYGGILATPRESAFSRVFPATIPFAEMAATYYPRARAVMGATPMPDDILADPAYTCERVFRQHATAIGLEVTAFDIGANWDVVRQEIAGTVPRSALNGEAIYGNNNGCKVSLDATYLKQAEDTGLCTVMPQHLVRDITHAASGKYVVMVDQIDEQGDAVVTKTFVCDFLFLAAGPYGTPNLLVKARAKGLLPMLDDNVGRGFGNNGGAMFARWGLTENTGMSQGGFAGHAMVDFANPVAPAMVEHAQLPTGTESHCLLNVGMAVVTGSGAFTYDAASDRAVPNWPSDGSAMPVAAMQDLANRLDTANGGTLNGSALGGAVTINGVLSAYTYHPLGGMVIGQATDLYGRVNNYPRLYVLDASLLPRMAGAVNPALTVAALAERCIERIIRDDMIG